MARMVVSAESGTNGPAPREPLQSISPVSMPTIASRPLPVKAVVNERSMM